MELVSERVAKTTDLVNMAEWGIEEMPSCCGAFILIRLRATYSRGTPDYSTYNMYDAQLKQFHKVLNCNDIYAQYNESPPLPLEMAYSAVLQDMRTYSKDTLFLATDNVTRDRMGDVHAGPFATRYFVRWLESNGLAEVTTSATCGRVEGYTIKLIRSKAYYMARKGWHAYMKLAKNSSKLYDVYSPADSMWSL